MKTSKTIINYLNRHVKELVDGEKLFAYSRIFWLNNTTMEIYCLTNDEYVSGVINGDRIAIFDKDCTIAPAMEE